MSPAWVLCLLVYAAIVVVAHGSALSVYYFNSVLTLALFLVVLGLGLRYGELPLLTPSQYLKFLPKLPYTFSSNFGGYLLVGVVAALCVYGAFKRRNNAALISRPKPTGKTGSLPI